jgi:hypothetical protein
LVILSIKDTNGCFAGQLWIKSSVGAKPISMYGLIEHSNPLINLLVSKAFSYFEPKMEWQERNPFKIKTHHGTAFQLFWGGYAYIEFSFGTIILPIHLETNRKTCSDGRLVR